MSAGDEPQPSTGNEPLTGAEQFYHKLMDESKTKFHTEINWPAPMTGLDVLRSYYRKYGMKSAGKVLDEYAEWYRTNMVAFKRKRAAETVAIAQAQAQQEKDRKSMAELMLGKAMR